MTAQARFRQIDLKRAVKAAEAAGIRIGQICIDIEGSIIITPEAIAKTAKRNSMDELLGR